MISIDLEFLNLMMVYIWSDLVNLFKERFETIVFWKHLFIESQQNSLARILCFIRYFYAFRLVEIVKFRNDKR